MKSVIESPWNVGDKLYCTAAATFSFTTFEGAMSNAAEKARAHNLEVFPIIQLRVVGVRMYALQDWRIDSDGPIPIQSAAENVYKVMRNRDGLDVVVLTQDMNEVCKVLWPESKPFHDAFGPIEEEGGFTQIIYVCALNVDGNYKLIEVLDDQDW